MPSPVPGRFLIKRAKSSHDLVQPVDLRALARLAEALQLVVPGAAEQGVDAEAELRPGRGGEQVAQPVLTDEQVAVRAHGGAEDAEGRGHRVPLPVAAGARLLGDLVAQDAPAPEGAGEPSCRARTPAPADL